MEKLFSYGTLQIESVQQETFGRQLNGFKDVLTGYCLSHVKIRDEAVIKTSGKDIHAILNFTGSEADRVVGTIFEISETEVHQADEYDVEEYTRILGNFRSGENAWMDVCAESETTNRGL